MIVIFDQIKYYTCVIIFCDSYSLLCSITSCNKGLSATKGYDCIEIPGAKLGTMCASFTMANAKQANRFCGNSQGLPKSTSAMATDGSMSGTICSNK